MSNLSILQRNICHALDCEIASTWFLRACDRTGVLAAERFAQEVKMIVNLLTVWLGTAARGYRLDSAPDGLLDFIIRRHWFATFPAAGGAA